MIALNIWVLLFFFQLNILHSIDPNDHDKACADFNFGAASAALAGLEDVYVCPSDGISRTICSESYRIKNVSNIVQPALDLSDIVFYMLMVIELR